jgi:hypothetical protein
MQPTEQPFGGDPSSPAESHEQAGGNGRAGREPVEGSKSFGELFQELVEGAGEISSYLKTLGAVRADRARLKLRKRAAAIASNLATMAALAVIALCGVVLFAVGFGALLGEWFESQGLGNLVAGVVLLGIVGVWFGVKASAKKRKELEFHRDKYARLEQEHRLRYGGYGADRPAPSRAQDDRGAARSGASEGAAGPGAARH